jgi:arabinose-5-phosphate isomerase
MHSGQLAAQALYEMEERKITSLVVIDEGNITGIIHLHDILRAGVA